MFESARLKLTAWYLLIIMVISVLFSIAVYQTATNEIERIINRIEFHQKNPNMPIPDHLEPQSVGHAPPSLHELIETRQRLLYSLIIINISILVLAGAAGYFLAGRTLRPIKEMLDDQNLFISSASHELRTPIAVMRAEMEGSLLEKNISDKHARELIASNLEELGDLQSLTNNLLELAQIHMGAPEMETEEIEIRDILHAAQKKVTPLAKKKNIEIDTKLVEANSMGIKKDLKEVFVILLENAIKYSPEKTTIHIASEKTKNTIVITIQDEGIGISEKDMSHIFERFYRADTSRNEDGYGLGLAIAKKTIDVHKGAIHVESAINKGTKFTVILPLRES